MSTQPALLPPPPRPGDTVAVVAPAGPMRASRLKRALDPLRDLGLNVVWLGPNAAESPIRYLAGSDDARLNALLRALIEPQFKAVICVRGGYGCMRLLSRLEARVGTGLGLNSRILPKRVCGFSDITALHAWAFHTMGWAGLHAPMPNNWSPSHPNGEMTAAVRESYLRFGRALMADAPNVTLEKGAASLEVVVEPERDVEGVLLGGNLSLIEAMYGSPWLQTLEGVLLFVEDVGEKPYRLDRLVTALQLRGAAREVKGVILGGFTHVDGFEPEEASRFAAELFSNWGVPVVRGLQAGHSDFNQSLWLGLRYRLTQNGTLQLAAGELGRGR